VPSITVTHFSDPGCPWAYSVSPAHAVLRWRYGEQLRWRLVLVGLTERAEQYVERGYTPERSAIGWTWFRRYGMPFDVTPKRRVAATSPGCRAVVAARLRAPGREESVFRALQLAQFTGGTLLDDPGDLRAALADVGGLDVDAIAGAIDDPDVLEAYEADKAETRTASGSPTEAQGKTARTDGPVRYTAPSLVFEAEDGRRLEAGGFQTLEAYDVCLANLAPDLERRGVPEDLAELLDWFPDGLVTQEVAALLVRANEPPDRAAAERALIGLVADGQAERVPLGDDALWRRPRG
jgi:protein-disulfide isomerase-like protein with CxxC motif